MSDKKQRDGLYISGILQGVDFAKSGKFEGTPYPAKVMLNFSVQEIVKKEINGTFITSQSMRSQIIKIDTSDDNIALEVEKYNKLVGSYQELKLLATQGTSFKSLL